MSRAVRPGIAEPSSEWGRALDVVDIEAVFRWARLAPDPWQSDVMAWWPTTADNLAYVAPRRVGKDATACAVAAHGMAFHDDYEVFVAGPTELHAVEDVRTIRSYLHAFPDHHAIRVVSDTKTGLELDNGSRVRIGTKNPDSARGAGADLVILTEASYLPDEMIAAVMPIVIQRRGRFLACSTPSRGESWFRRVLHEPDGAGRGWRTMRITPADTPRFNERMREGPRGTLSEEAYKREMEGVWADGDDGTETALENFPLASSPVTAARRVADVWAGILRERNFR